MFHTTKPLKNLQVDFYIEITKIDEGKREKLMAKSGMIIILQLNNVMPWNGKGHYQLVVNTLKMLLCNNWNAKASHSHFIG